MERVPIVCPYCFNVFTDTQTIFRAKHSFAKSELIGKNDEETKKRWHFIPFDEFEGELGDLPEGMVIDRKLVDFWAMRGGLEGYRVADPEWYLPHIDPSSPSFPEMVQFSPLGGVVPDADGFVRDADGFAYRVIERYETIADEPMARLCPYCHNRLPLPDYGKFRTVFIGVVGMTGSGKTVYLSQLLSSLSSHLKNTGYHIGASYLGINRIQNQGVLPGATDISVMRRPKAINIIADDPAYPSYTLVFYDIAGENCIDEYDDDPDTLKRKQVIASYLGHVDALLFLIDPVQLPYLSGGMRGMRKDVDALINKVVTIRSLNTQSPNWDRTPVAVVVTKADLEEVAPRIEKAIGFPLEEVSETDAQGNPYWGFPRAEYVPINRGLHQAFKEHMSDVEEGLCAFKTRGYFAVSALCAGVSERIRMHANSYQLTEDSAERVREMRTWLIGWDRRSPVDRPYYDGGAPGQSQAICPVVRTSEGEPLVMDVNKSSREYFGVMTDIKVRKLAQNGGGFAAASDEVFLTVGDILTVPAESIAKDSRSIRIEEPLKWILWQLGIITGPVPQIQQEPYPFMCSKKRKRELDAEFEARKAAYYEAFYGCEEP